MQKSVVPIRLRYRRGLPKIGSTNKAAVLKRPLAASMRKSAATIRLRYRRGLPKIGCTLARLRRAEEMDGPKTGGTNKTAVLKRPLAASMQKSAAPIRLRY